MSSQNWNEIITSEKKLLNLNIREILKYRDLLFLFVKRDLVTIYKQTILGPLWYLIQPLFTSLIFTLIFNNVANIDTKGVPPFLFNLSGVIIWNYFSDCFVGTSDTFKKNEEIFGKVYFPRVIMPASIIVSNLLKFGIQMLIFIAAFCYYYFNSEIGLPSSGIIYFPFLVLGMGLMGLSLGMITSSLTTKYRDLIFLISFGVQILMYLSAVMYPIEIIVQEMPNIAFLVEYNPLAQIIDISRKSYFFDSGLDVGLHLFYPLGIAVVLFFLGLTIFNRTEKSFIDTI
mgnify:CR=1 FL=1|tara:strand:+ start:820 stop:1677 length:858 start_codon:yes stop_codon:yes gene_type:complete